MNSGITAEIKVPGLAARLRSRRYLTKRADDAAVRTGNDDERKLVARLRPLSFQTISLSLVDVDVNRSDWWPKAQGVGERLLIGRVMSETSTTCSILRVGTRGNLLRRERMGTLRSVTTTPGSKSNRDLMARLWR